MSALSQDCATTLSTLKDLEGVIGSFLVSATGTIVAQDLPSFFGSAAYEVGPRAQRLRQALAMTEGDVSLCHLKFGSHKVTLRPIGEGLLAILSQDRMSVPALRMATNLVSKKLSFAVIADAQSTPPPPTVRPIKGPSQTAQAHSRSLGAPEGQAQRPKKKRAMYFRGKRID